MTASSSTPAGRWKRGGLPGVDGGITGGAIFTIWMKDSEIAHNRFLRTQPDKADEFYGIKGRQGKRSRIHHNTIEVNFSIELPFENDEDMEIDHNVCHGTVSLPKHAGGPVSRERPHVSRHHNWFKHGYSIEFVRNGIEISHNLFDFDIEQDGGNLISGFGRAPAVGRRSFTTTSSATRGAGDLDQRGLQQPGSPQQSHHHPHDRHAAQGRAVRLQSRLRLQDDRHS